MRIRLLYWLVIIGFIAPWALYWLELAPPLPMVLKLVVVVVSLILTLPTIGISLLLNFVPFDVGGSLVQETLLWALLNAFLYFLAIHLIVKARVGNKRIYVVGSILLLVGLAYGSFLLIMGAGIALLD